MYAHQFSPPEIHNHSKPPGVSIPEPGSRALDEAVGWLCGMFGLREREAQIIHPPVDYPYGERQHAVEDIAGYRWTILAVDCRCRSNRMGGELLDD